MCNQSAYKTYLLHQQCLRRKHVPRWQTGPELPSTVLTRSACSHFKALCWRTASETSQIWGQQVSYFHAQADNVYFMFHTLWMYFWMSFLVDKIHFAAAKLLKHFPDWQVWLYAACACVCDVSADSPQPCGSLSHLGSELYVFIFHKYGHCAPSWGMRAQSLQRGVINGLCLEYCNISTVDWASMTHVTVEDRRPTRCVYAHRNRPVLRVEAAML